MEYVFRGQDQVNATSYSTGSVVTANYPVSTITIEMLKDNDGASGTYDAEIIWNSLGEKLSVRK